MRNETADFRKVGLCEGISYLLLLGVAMPLKYMAGIPLGVRIVGTLHGILFVAYVLLGIKLARAQGWPFIRIVYLFVAAIVPFGPFIFDRTLKDEHAGSRTAV